MFDNSDNRFSLENSDEVVLRRTIGHKKDEFFLQRKRANKTEIMSLLEGGYIPLSTVAGTVVSLSLFRRLASFGFGWRQRNLPPRLVAC